MSDWPETLDAILAYFRQFALRAAEEDKMISPESVLLLADRIERAVSLERIELREDEAKMLLREYAAAPDESLTPSALELKRELLRLAPAPGNAAAMREALEKAKLYFYNRGEGTNIDDAAMAIDAITSIYVALAAPARNCDRFATAEEAVAAFADHLRAWENAHGVCSEHPDHPVQVPAGAFAWLFAPAEGGDHA